MTQITDTIRADLLNRAVSATTRAQLLPVRREMQEWLRAHPDDEAMRAVAENLERLAKHFEDRTPDIIDYLTTTPMGTRGKG
jgi:hypothetical protein